MNPASSYAMHTCRTAMAGAILLLPALSSSANEQQWRFHVYLDDRIIGHHHFTLVRNGPRVRMESSARFKVTFLKVPFYRYSHDSIELWNGGCLESISSRTDQNGNHYNVEGMATATGFSVRMGDSETTLPDCVSTFAYWNKDFLNNSRLLNSQTGEYLDVNFSYEGKTGIPDRKAISQAHRYSLDASDIDIEVWYSNDDRWLALESTTADGSLLRYVAE